MIHCVFGIDAGHDGRHGVESGVNERGHEDAAARSDVDPGEDDGVRDDAQSERPELELGIRLAGEEEGDVDEGPRDPDDQRSLERRHRGHQPRQGEATPGDLLGERRQQDDEEDDDDPREDLVEQASRRGAHEDGDADGRKRPDDGQTEDQVPAAPRRTERQRVPEPAERAIAFTPRQPHRDDRWPEGEDERQHRRRGAGHDGNEGEREAEPEEPGDRHELSPRRRRCDGVLARDRRSRRDPRD